MTQDGMTIRLYLERMKVVRVVEDEIDKLVIEVADTRRVARCPACGHKTTKVHETHRFVVRDIPLRRPTILSGCSGASSATTAGSATPKNIPRSRAR